MKKLMLVMVMMIISGGSVFAFAKTKLEPVVKVRKAIVDKFVLAGAKCVVLGSKIKGRLK